MKTVTRTLFNPGNPYPQKKVLTFNRHTSDFSFNVFYGDTSFMTDAEERFVVCSWRGLWHCKALTVAIDGNVSISFLCEEMKKVL